MPHAKKLNDAIRFGFGLRWGQMGLFETYRCGGEAGYAPLHDEQSGLLHGPGPKLMDVP